MTANAISQFAPFNLADAAKQACDGAVQTFNTDLKPQLGSLTDDERASLPRVNANLDEFSDKGLAYGRSNPDLLPASVDIDEYQNDTDAITILTPYIPSEDMWRLLSRIEDIWGGRLSEIVLVSLKVLIPINWLINPRIFM